MGIAGFPSLGMPLNLAEPEYLEHVSSVFRFSLRVCEQNWPLCIGTLQFLNSSSYWCTETIQSLSYLDQVKQFILESGSVPDQGTISFSYFCNPPHRGESISSPDPSTLSDHLTTTIVYVSPSGSWLLILDPSGAESSVCIDSCFSLHRRNCEHVDSLLETTTLPILDRVAPDLGIHLSSGMVVFTTS